MRWGRLLKRGHLTYDRNDGNDKKKKEAAVGREAIEQWEYQVEGSIMVEPSLQSSVNTRWPLWLEYSE